MLVLANIFQPLIDVFEAVLKFIHNNLGVSWGFSIVLLTVVIRAVLIPLTLKQFHSMQALQRLQPELKALQNKYKDDKQRQQQEIMKFYKENKVNPLGSCLPLVAQLPVFVSLFYMLRQSLRGDICPNVQTIFHAAGHAGTTPCGAGHGAGFLFISDLTNKATGATLIVLIVLYVGTQLASSLMMSSATMDKTQRQIMLFMPLVFVIFIISFPAGVIVYWITTNSWTILQQYIVKKRLGPPPPPVVATATAGVAPSGGSRGGGARSGRAPDAEVNGSSGSSGVGAGIGAVLRRTKPPAEEKAGVSAGRQGRPAAPPPRPPRKKKKRSGRRR
jgi:YidC/Oxa1 family membrane protein insertase